MHDISSTTAVHAVVCCSNGKSLVLPHNETRMGVCICILFYIFQIRSDRSPNLPLNTSASYFLCKESIEHFTSAHAHAEKKSTNETNHESEKENNVSARSRKRPHANYKRANGLDHSALFASNEQRPWVLHGATATAKGLKTFKKANTNDTYRQICSLQSTQIVRRGRLHRQSRHHTTPMQCKRDRKYTKYT